MMTGFSEKQNASHEFKEYSKILLYKEGAAQLISLFSGRIQKHQTWLNYMSGEIRSKGHVLLLSG